MAGRSVLPESSEYSLAGIEAEAQRMGSLVADLLLLARLDDRARPPLRTDRSTRDIDIDRVRDDQRLVSSPRTSVVWWVAPERAAATVQSDSGAAPVLSTITV
ncbi:hypothetical protein AU197_24060 [Mycobacterium sp. IS-1590]|nr:hypothetical protein AU197_24060 [Mycobacterium sp. IS-1590]